MRKNSDHKTFYLAGGMSGLSKEEMLQWRLDIQKMFTDVPHIFLFNPVRHWNMDNPEIDEREAMDYDLCRLRNSDLVIMNFNQPNSLGTMAELGIAYELRIPIIGIVSADKKDKLHPWQLNMVSHWCSNLDDVYEYIILHYAYYD